MAKIQLFFRVVSTSFYLFTTFSNWKLVRYEISELTTWPISVRICPKRPSKSTYLSWGTAVAHFLHLNLHPPPIPPLSPFPPSRTWSKVEITVSYQQKSIEKLFQPASQNLLTVKKTGQKVLAHSKLRSLILHIYTTFGW